MQWVVTEWKDKRVLSPKVASKNHVGMGKYFTDVQVINQHPDPPSCWYIKGCGPDGVYTFAILLDHVNSAYSMVPFCSASRMATSLASGDSRKWSTERRSHSAEELATKMIIGCCSPPMTVSRAGGGTMKPGVCCVTGVDQVSANVFDNRTWPRKRHDRSIVDVT